MRRGRLVVAIDGPGCCGKSTLAGELLRFTRASVLGTDDFHLPRGIDSDPQSPLPYRRWKELVAAVESLVAGRPASFRPIDWVSRGLLAEVEVQPAPLLVIEGIGALHPSIAGMADYRIWVDGAAPSRMRRVGERDGESEVPNWEQYVQFEQAYLETCRPWVDVDLWVFGAELTFANSDRAFSRLIERHGSASNALHESQSAD